MAKLHDTLLPISWLDGEWISIDGLGEYPTIKPFQYHEQLHFKCLGQPMFNYVAISRHAEKQNPMHQEHGFLRSVPGTNQFVFTLAHNTGIATIEEGTLNEEGNEIEFCTMSISRPAVHKKPCVVSTKRCYKYIKPDTLEVCIYMETDNMSLKPHLKATYKRAVVPLSW